MTIASIIERDRSSTGAKSLPQLFSDNAAQLGNRPCMREKHRGIWRQWTWQQVFEDVRALAAAFHELGVKPGDRMIILGENRPRLYWAMSAAQWLGSTPVPLAADTPADALARVVAELDVSVVVVDGSGQYEKLLRAGEAIRPKLNKVIVDNLAGLEVSEALPVNPMDDLITAGRQAGSPTKAKLDQALSSRQLQDCVADLPFSHITLGSPAESWSQMQSVRVTHADAIEYADQDLKAHELGNKDDVIAYLPFGSWADLYGSHILPLTTGVTVNFPEAADTIAVDIREIGPTIHFIPDWAIKKLRDAALARAEGAGGARLAKSIEACRVRRNPWTLLLQVVLLWPMRDVLGLSRTRIMFIVGDPKRGAVDFLTALGIPSVQSKEPRARAIATSNLLSSARAGISIPSVVH
ncbi:hypothetical protein UNPF46_30145 [Bradyrhizobium sp. UNPF46]|uniref:AMP-binding protein n=1 Tax=Bradyrhizobium sp. UNPF46 TaxID=1141168 RepID=UPI001151AEC8|nr:AMP-binding protein [Bradyrhizobium sp. UNPF46]TQF27589.1 hypothetical protein UNPF46_30145 [Bradyrhizobium sp. UNPF46]